MDNKKQAMEALRTLSEAKTKILESELKATLLNLPESVTASLTETVRAIDATSEVMGKSLVDEGILTDNECRLNMY